jgi:hypothetical protein
MTISALSQKLTTIVSAISGVSDAPDDEVFRNARNRQGRDDG